MHFIIPAIHVIRFCSISGDQLARQRLWRVTKMKGYHLKTQWEMPVVGRIPQKPFFIIS